MTGRTQETGLPTGEDMAGVLAVSLAQMAIAVVPVIKAVEGYRATLERHGYGDAQARKMAADYHAALLRVVFR